MTSRRAVLKAAGLFGVAIFTGCSFLDPTIANHSPSPLGSATPTSLPHSQQGLETIETVHRSALGVVHGGSPKTTAALVSVAAWTDVASTAHEQAVHNDSPVVIENPVASASATSSASASSPTTVPVTTWDQFLTTVSQGSGQHRKRALDSDGVHRLVWASLAACYSAIPHARSAPKITQSDLIVTATPAADSEVTELRNVVSQLHAVCFALEMALVAVPTTDAARTAFVAEWNGWVQQRDKLMSSLRTLGQTPPGSLAPYDITVPANTTAAYALVASTLSALQPQIGSWVMAAASTRASAVDLLAKAATSATTFGATLAAWPGWPASTR